MTYKEALEHLNRYRQMDSNSWGLFFLGVQMFLGQTRVYASEKSARRRLLDELKEYILKPYPPSSYQWTTPTQRDALIDKFRKDDKIYKEKYTKMKERTNKVISDLEATGMLEIRRIGDRSPKFPFNKPNIDKEQAEKFSKMLDASDKEMVNLAITILEKI